MGDLDLPFMPQDPTPMHDFDQAVICGGVVCMATVVTLGDESKMPGVVFRFTQADGSGFLRPIVLVGDDQTLAALRPLVVEAVQAGRRAAKGATS